MLPDLTEYDCNNPAQVVSSLGSRYPTPVYKSPACPPVYGIPIIIRRIPALRKFLTQLHHCNLKIQKCPNRSCNSTFPAFIVQLSNSSIMLSKTLRFRFDSLFNHSRPGRSRCGQCSPRIPAMQLFRTIWSI